MQVKAVSNARSAQKVKKGVSLHSKCNNKNCERHNRSIKQTIGMGKFNINKAVFNVICPLCQQKAKPATNMGFYKCKVFIEGEKNDGE